MESYAELELEETSLTFWVGIVTKLISIFHVFLTHKNDKYL